MFLLLRRVSPGEYSFASSDGNPGTNGEISKTRCGAWNKEHFREFATDLSEGTTGLTLRSHRRAIRLATIQIFAENAPPALCLLH